MLGGRSLDFGLRRAMRLLTVTAMPSKSGLALGSSCQHDSIRSQYSSSQLSSRGGRSPSITCGSVETGRRGVLGRGKEGVEKCPHYGHPISTPRPYATHITAVPPHTLLAIWMYLRSAYGVVSEPTSQRTMP